jgi:hypothetical protein
MNIFKAISTGMAVLTSVGEAVDPASEGGEKITEREVIRIGVRSALTAVRSFNAEIVKDDSIDLIEIVREELQLAGMM